MHTRVQLNPTKLAVLSIPKDKYWILTAPILQLLYHEASKLDEGGEHFDSSEEEERDSHGLYEPNNRYESESDDSNQDEDYAQGFSSFKEQWQGANRQWTRKMTKLSRRFDSSFGEKESSNHGIRHDLVDNSSKFLSDERSESADFLEDLSSSVPSSEEESLNYHDHYENYFFHIAFSPIECTVICSTDVMKKLFRRPLDVCKALNYDDVKLLDKPYLSLFIDCDRSLDNTPAILELTRPLSDNNITLFFLSSHYSNIVLIPYDSEERVINILTKKNFEFSDVSKSFIASNTEANDDIDGSQIADEKSEDTPLYNISRFVENGTIVPCINSNVKLLLTGSRSGKVVDTIMKTSKIVSERKLPEYFCITRTSFNEVSLILPHSSKKRSIMGFDSKNIIGSVQDIIIPITIDLQKLPLDSTGIVAGLSSKLLEGVKTNTDLYDTFEMSYLSMARSAIMMIPEENLEQVAHILNSFKHES